MKHDNKLQHCDFCGETSELIGGACAGCVTRYGLDASREFDAPRRAAVRLAVTLITRRQSRQHVHVLRDEFSQGQHSANDLYPALLERRRQTLAYELRAAPEVVLDKLLRPVELALNAQASPMQPPAAEAPLQYGRRWNDGTTLAWQESMGIEAGVAA